jgi:hypothetical protein
MCWVNIYMELGPDELIFNTDKDGNVTAAGFSVNSCLLRSGGSPRATVNGGSSKGGSVSEVFKNLAVPAGLLYMQRSLSSSYPSVNKEEAAPETLYNKLLDLATDQPKPQKRRKSRRKRKKSPQNNTRRRK